MLRCASRSASSCHPCDRAVTAISHASAPAVCEGCERTSIISRLCRPSSSMAAVTGARSIVASDRARPNLSRPSSRTHWTIPSIRSSSMSRSPLLRSKTRILLRQEARNSILMPRNLRRTARHRPAVASRAGAGRRYGKALLVLLPREAPLFEYADAAPYRGELGRVSSVACPQPGGQLRAYVTYLLDGHGAGVAER